MNNKGFGLLEALLGVVVLSLSMWAILQLVLWLRIETTKLDKLRSELQDLSDALNGATSVTWCAADDQCPGTPKVCLYEPANNKDMVVCADACTFVGGFWQYNGNVCTRGVMK